MNALKIGIAGLGTVGIGVVKIISQHSDLLEKRCSRKIEICAINAKSRKKDRGIDLSPYHWVNDCKDFVNIDELDVVVELIGGSEGVAKELVKESLLKGKHVVTANKALMAHHGVELATIAEEKGVSLRYEAAVAGGIPVIKAIDEGFAANDINAVYGILNGTCNYILTEMRETGRDFSDVLKDAQNLGYAEADPTFDVEGVDAAHKLAILSGLSFGVKPDFEKLSISGISSVTSDDIKFAGELGYKIKLLGITRCSDKGIEQSVEPCLVPKNSAIASVEGVFNAVYVDGDFVDKGLLVGRGAGEGPTASSVVADIIDIARGFNKPTFGVPIKSLKDALWVNGDDIIACNYLRFVVIDQSGVIADVAAILKKYDISVESFIQRGRDPGQPVSIVMTTHEAKQGDLKKAVKEISQIKEVKETPHVIRIEHL